MIEQPTPWFWVDFNDLTKDGEVEVVYGPPFNVDAVVGDHEGNTAKGIITECVVLKIKVDMSTFEPADDEVGDRFDEIGELEDGWCGPGTKAINPDMIFAARRFHGELIDVSGSVSPMPNGNIVFEWKRGETSYSAEFEVGGGMYLYRHDAKTNQTSDWHTRNFNPEELLRFMREGFLKCDPQLGKK